MFTVTCWKVAPRVDSYLQETLPAHMCPLNSGGPRQTSHWTNCLRCPTRSKRKDGGIISEGRKHDRDKVQADADAKTAKLHLLASVSRVKLENLWNVLWDMVYWAACIKMYMLTWNATAETKNVVWRKENPQKDTFTDEQQIFLLLKAEKGCDVKVVTSQVTTVKSGYCGIWIRNRKRYFYPCTVETFYFHADADFLKVIHSKPVAFYHADSLHLSCKDSTFFYKHTYMPAYIYEYTHI